MRILTSAIMLLLLLAVGCGSDDATPSSTTTAAAGGAATEPAASEPAAPEPAAPSEPAEGDAQEPSAAGGSIVVDPGALVVADTSLTFGDTDQATAVAALTSALGEPTSQQEALECGPGALDAVNWEGLSTYYQDGTLAGWYLQDPVPGDAATTEGVGLGTKLGDVRGAYGDVTVEETTIGFEFTAGELSGLLTADSDHDTVVVLWSGFNCIAR